MAEPLDPATYPGAHPTTQDFLNCLLDWGFVQRGHDGPHVVYRAPGGGQVKLLGSLVGRPTANQVAKAAKYVNRTIEAFWAGPGATAEETTRPRPAAVSTPEPAPTQPRRRQRNDHDSAPATVLAIHTKSDRPLSLDEVVTRAGGRLNRQQVSAASSTLCRDGNLERVRPGVYQWSGQPRSAEQAHFPDRRSPIPSPRSEPVPTTAAAAELFARFFPDGAHLTAETFAELLQFAAFTEKLSARSY